MSTKLARYLRAFFRTWTDRSGTQLATLSVLVGAYVVSGFVLLLSLNLQNLLKAWGESIQISVYLEDDLNQTQKDGLRESLESDQRIERIEYVSKQQASETFRDQIANYAPDLLNDAEFSNPFPASFILKLKSQQTQTVISRTLEKIAGELKQKPGVEDVSYGQGWIENYSAFVTALTRFGWVLGFTLLAGSLFVISNSVRASVAARREEIEILELIGETKQMIRAPFIFEGAVMGFMAASLAVFINFLLLQWQLGLIEQSLTLARVQNELVSFAWPIVILILFFGTFVGVIGSYLAIRQINSGWSASRA